MRIPTKEITVVTDIKIVDGVIVVSKKNITVLVDVYGHDRDRDDDGTR